MFSNENEVLAFLEKCENKNLYVKSITIKSNEITSLEIYE